MPDTAVITTRGEFLAHDLLSRESISFNEYFLYPSAWVDRLKVLFREHAEAIATRGYDQREGGYWHTYDQVSVWLVENFFPAGHEFHNVITLYPQVVARWLYEAVNRAHEFTPPVPDLDVENAMQSVETLEQRFAVGTRWRVTRDRTTSTPYLAGDVVEVHSNGTLDRNPPHVRVTPIRSGTVSSDNGWVIYIRDLEPITDTPTVDSTWQVGDTLRITGDREHGMSTTTGDLVEVTRVREGSEGRQSACVRVTRSATPSIVGVEYGLDSRHAEKVTETVESLRAEVARLTALIESIASIIAPF